MDKIEKYAVDMVASGAQSFAEDDMDEDGEFADPAAWRTAVDLGVGMALMIKANPEGFLNWYKATMTAPGA